MKELLNKIIERILGKKIPKMKYIEPRVEKDTNCDKCEYLEKCKVEKIVIDCAGCEDTRSHYIVGLGENCKKAMQKNMAICGFDSYLNTRVNMGKGICDEDD